MKITETVVEIGTNKVGIICEVKENTEGPKEYLVDFNGAKIWKNEGQIMVYLTSENTNYRGEMLNG